MVHSKAHFYKGIDFISLANGYQFRYTLCHTHPVQNMPELPEVETIVRELNASDLIGKRIIETIVYWPRSIAIPEIDLFSDQLHNQSILKISRRGKYIVFTLSHSTLLVHLRMTGKFTLSKAKQKAPLHERVQLRLSDGRTLHFADQRKFGKFYLLSHPEAKLSELGLEPLSEEYTFEAFQGTLGNRSSQIKPFLLNQRYIVGLGNIYVDEALWEARIAPTRRVNSLNPLEIRALFHAIPYVLIQGIENMGTSLGSKNANYFSVSGRRGFHQSQLKVFRREGLPCPRCQTVLIKITLAQRGTHLCPSCQK